MNAENPSIEDIDALVGFLPRFSKASFQPILRWEGGDDIGDGVFQIPYPIYDPTVEDFVHLASQPCWTDIHYRANDMIIRYALDNRCLISDFSFAEIKTFLTFFVRRERFCDGHWGKMIADGYIQEILIRLEILKRSD